MADDEGNAVAGLSLGKARERSANLFSDPKMKELQHYTRSHQHEARLREAAALEERVRTQQGLPRVPATTSPEATNGLRTDGCDAVNRLLLRMASEKVTLPESPKRSSNFQLSTGATEEVPKVSSIRESQFQPRLQWRHEMDRSLRRLMQDMEFARDDRLKEYSHQACCGHLDKIFDWYQHHGKKEAKKERIAPPYVFFSNDGDVMPGSMRVTRSKLMQKEKAKKDGSGGMSQSSSSPALVAAGQMNLGESFSSQT
eukprot:TRINITY_DN59224_c0_g1_i1.p1 TRINITY_DN59224_c0_g1~~TRINITY_DN59224_c0_g1_i1.p1  ORF type:complete len:256 (-),score=54.22 TRINITY_DN59224_c0_g1_i1:7-774(-)